MFRYRKHSFGESHTKAIILRDLTYFFSGPIELFIISTTFRLFF